MIGYRRDSAESRYLKPHGLSASELLDRMTEFDPAFVADLQSKLENYPVEIETIITGIDQFGHHLFMINDRGEISCADAISFACIGSGASHAESQFMLARYQRSVSWQEAITLTCIAKKRSEVSPTVGPDTDLFFIGRDGFNVFAEEIHTHMDGVYGKLEDKIQKATKDAVAEVQDFLDGVMRQHQAKQSATSPPPPSPQPPSRDEQEPPTS